jgi:hypothetical protein
MIGMNAGYQVYFALDGGGGLLVRPEPPVSVVTTVTQPAAPAAPGQPTLEQQTHYDPAGCTDLLEGNDPERVGRQYLDLYRYTYGDEVEVTILAPGATRQFVLGGQGGQRPAILTVRAAPPESVEVIVYARLPNGQCMATPYVQDRFVDAEAYAALISGVGAEEVARRYAAQYEGRFGAIDDDVLAAAARGSGAPTPPKTVSWRAWVIPVLIGLALIVALLVVGMTGTGQGGPRRHGQMVLPESGLAPPAPPVAKGHHGGQEHGDDD